MGTRTVKDSKTDAHRRLTLINLLANMESYLADLQAVMVMYVPDIRWFASLSMPTDSISHQASKSEQNTNPLSIKSIYEGALQPSRGHWVTVARSGMRLYTAFSRSLLCVSC